jgi:hypothetical protein
MYIAASFPKKAEMRVLRNQIHAHTPVQVKANWLDGAHDGYGNKPEYAVDDANQVLAADIVLICTGDTMTRGGRHTELGIAIAYNMMIHAMNADPEVGDKLPKKLIILYNPAAASRDGCNEQVFHSHPEVGLRVNSKDALMSFLSSC